MPNANATDLLQQLIVQLERAWSSNRDDQLVDRLAAENPMLAEDLYEFFADLVEADVELDRARQEFAAADERARKWLENEGYQMTAAAHRAADAEQTPTTDPNTPSSSPSPGSTVPCPAARAGSPGSGDFPTPRPFLGLLRQVTGESTLTLALALNITVDFLVDISDNADVLPEAARIEFADRAERARGIERRRSLEALATSDSQFAKAASRARPYEGSTVTYVELVRRSGLDPERKQYWLRFA